MVRSILKRFTTTKNAIPKRSKCVFVGFSSSVKKLAIGSTFKEYLTLRADLGKRLTNYTLRNSEGGKSDFINTNSKITLLDFWASWSAAVGLECPFLRKFTLIIRKGISGISIDENATFGRKHSV